MSIDESPQNLAPPGLSRRRFWLILALALIGLALIGVAVVYLAYLRDIPLEISAETTHVTEPLTADGAQVDYFAAVERLLYPPEMQTDENGFRLFIENIGPGSDLSSREARQLYEKLGLAPVLAPPLAYKDPMQFLIDHVSAEVAAGSLTLPAETNAIGHALDIEDDVRDRPWTLDEFPMMAGWIDGNREALDVVAEAVRKPVFCRPWIESGDSPTLLAASIGDAQSVRGIARGYVVRAMYYIAAGDIDRAIDDIVSCARLGRHLERAGSTIDFLVGIACEAMAYAVGPGRNLEHQPTAEQWRRLLDDIDNLPAYTSLDQLIEFKRLFTLQVVQSMAWGEADDVVAAEEFAFLRNRRFGIDWNIVAETVNDSFDGILHGRPAPVVDVTEFNQFMSRATRSRLLGEYLVDFLVAGERFHAAIARTVCKENLLRIVIAMLLYEKEHGALPPAYSVDGNGNPLHSWRVLILPFLGQEDLYARIRLDEPWDSVHNRQFHAVDLPVYQCPAHPHAAGETTYAVIEGPNCAFEGGVGKRLDAFGPHSANLILVTERLNAACWMDPTQEVAVADALLGINWPGAATGLGSDHAEGITACFRSGAVKFISENIDRVGYLAKLLDGTLDKPF